MALQVESGVTLYHKLRQELEHQLLQRSWPPDAPLPTEEELCAQYQVSRATVRRALAEMERRGLVYRKQGRGSFVRGPALELRGRHCISFSENMRRRGIIPGSRLLHLTRVEVEGRVAQALAIAPGTACFQLERLRLGDGEPLFVTTSYLPVHLCPGLEADRALVEEPDFSLHGYLARHWNLVLVRSRAVLTPVIATERDAELLHQALPAALFELQTQNWSQTGVVVEYALDRIRPDRYTFELQSEE